MGNLMLSVWIILIIAATIVSGKPTNFNRQKRQSDQRIAELETLLALEKYGQHQPRLRDWGRSREAPPGYGLIDFDKLGRRKKSTRFSPGEDPDSPFRAWLSSESSGLTHSNA